MLFVTDYNSNIFWDTASPPLSVRGNVAQKVVFLDGENIFVEASKEYINLTLQGNNKNL